MYHGSWNCVPCIKALDLEKYNDVFDTISNVQCDMDSHICPLKPNLSWDESLNKRRVLMEQPHIDEDYYTEYELWQGVVVYMKG